VSAAAARFWSRVDASRGPDACWLWTGARQTKRGVQTYGHLWVGGKTVSAHRFAYELRHGAIDTSLQVLHACDNKICVNPAHLRLGNDTDNIVDAYDRGLRTYLGRACKRLTTAEVSVARQARETGITIRALAQRMRCSYGAMRAALRGGY
jgi:hypothetical protein